MSPYRAPPAATIRPSRTSAARYLRDDTTIPPTISAKATA
jgi:hypothetical protein